MSSKMAPPTAPGHPLSSSSCWSLVQAADHAGVWRLSVVWGPHPYELSDSGSTSCGSLP